MANNSLPSPAAIEGINGAQKGMGRGRGGAVDGRSHLEREEVEPGGWR